MATPMRIKNWFWGRPSGENERLRAALIWISHIEMAQDKDYAIKTAAKLAREALNDD